MSGKKKEAPKKKRGRPTAYKPEYAKIAYRCCLLGDTNEILAKRFGVSKSSITKWISENKEFSTALKKGRELADQHVTESLYKRAVGYSHPDLHISTYLGKVTKTKIMKHYPPDVAAAFIWLKNRRPDQWKEKPEHGADGENKPLPVSVTIVAKDASIKKT